MLKQENKIACRSFVRSHFRSVRAFPRLCLPVPRSACGEQKKERRFILKLIKKNSLRISTRRERLRDTSEGACLASGLLLPPPVLLLVLLLLIIDVVVVVYGVIFHWT